ESGEKLSPIGFRGKMPRVGMQAGLRNHLFVSYSHKDRSWLDQLLTMLDPAVRNRSVAIRADTRIPQGGTARRDRERSRRGERGPSPDQRALSRVALYHRA